MVKKIPKHQEAPGRSTIDSPGLSTPRRSGTQPTFAFRFEVYYADHLKSPKPESKRTSKKWVDREESEQEDCFVVEENNLNTLKRKGPSCRYESEKYSK